MRGASLVWLWIGFVSIQVACAQTNLHTIVNDGAWTWYNDPRAVFQNGRLFVGYVRNGDGRTVLTAYDPATGQASNLWNSSWSERDDHNNPGLLPLQDGRMMAFYARHSSVPQFAYRTSLNTNPITAGDWGPERILSTSVNVTYSNPYQLSNEGGRIYNFMRNLNFNPTFTLSDDLGTNWSAPKILIQTGSGGIRPYVKYASDYASRMDFLYTDGHPRDVSNSLYHAYYREGAFFKTDGTFLKYFTNAPLLHDAGERGSVIYQYSDAPSSDPNVHIPAGRAWSWEIVHDTNAQPVCVFTVQRDNVTGPNWSDDRIYYYYARWTGAAWQKRFVAHAGRPLYQEEDDYAGGICIDPEDPNVIYLSSNAAEPFDLDSITNVPLRANARYELYRGVTADGGLTFSWTAVTSNSIVDNLRPYVPRNHRSAPAVIWFRGTYSAYTTFDCSVVALLTNRAFLRPSVRIESPRASVIHLTNLSNGLKLSAVATDDGVPAPLSVQWSTATGPTNAAFEDPSNTDTIVRFPRAGMYVLRVVASDTLSTAEASVIVHAGALNTDTPDSTRELWLKLDETSGTTAADASGHFHSASLSGGATWAASGGQRGGALAFNGVDASATVADSSTLDNTSTFTLAYWFRVDGWPANNAALVSKREGLSAGNAYSMFIDGTTRRINIDVDGANNRFTSRAIIQTNAWYHAALVYNGSLPSVERVQLWINGQLDVTATESSIFLLHYASSFRLGSMPASSPTWLQGVLDDVRFYRRALSPTEVISLALSNSGPSVVVTGASVGTNGIPLQLNGLVSDDGRGGPLGSWWEKVGGPGEANFVPSNNSSTIVTFDRAGDYTLRLNASDSMMTVCQDVAITVAPNSNIYEDWIARAFPDSSDPAIIARTADPDGDTQPNFLEFAFGLDPTQPELSPLHIEQTSGGAIRLTHPRRLDRTRLQYHVLTSSNLHDWQPADAALTLELIVRPPDQSEYETVTYQLEQVASSAFFRVSVE
jgi:hypothetical protein